MGIHATTEGLARVGEIGVAFESAGSGEPALVFVHGFAADRTYFSRQIEHFLGRRRVVALDLRGHGDSSRSPEAGLDDFAADVMAVTDAAGVNRAVICGHSMAGVVGLKVALARPELVEGVVMIESTVLFPQDVREQALTTFVPVLATEHAHDALRGFFKNVILGRDDPPDLVERVLAAADQVNPQLAHAFFADLWSSDYSAELASAPCRLLYIHAKTPTDLQRLRRLRTDALLEEMPDSGHYPMLTAPDEVNALLESFLAVAAETRE